MSNEDITCGCCGRAKPEGAEWCDDCKFHVLTPDKAAWTSTYRYQHKQACPFQDPATDLSGLSESEIVSRMLEG